MDVFKNGACLFLANPQCELLIYKPEDLSSGVTFTDTSIIIVTILVAPQGSKVNSTCPLNVLNTAINIESSGKWKL